MKIPTGDEYDRLKRAFNGLSDNIGFVIIVEFLRQVQAEDLKSLATLTDELHVRWMQGEVQALNTILQLADPRPNATQRQQPS